MDQLRVRVSSHTMTAHRLDAPACSPQRAAASLRPSHIHACPAERYCRSPPHRQAAHSDIRAPGADPRYTASPPPEPHPPGSSCGSSAARSAHHPSAARTQTGSALRRQSRCTPPSGAGAGDSQGPVPRSARETGPKDPKSGQHHAAHRPAGPPLPSTRRTRTPIPLLSHTSSLFPWRNRSPLYPTRVQLAMSKGCGKGSPRCA